MGYTRKPCPACGEGDIMRKKDDICSSCRRELEFAKKMRAHYSQVDSDQVVVYYMNAPHWNQHFYFHTMGAGDDIEGDLQRAFFSLAKALTTPYTGPIKDSIALLGKGKGLLVRSDNVVFTLLPKDVAEAICALHLLIQPAIDSAYEVGKREGHSLLKRLASGDLSAHDFNAKVRE